MQHEARIPQAKNEFAVVSDNVASMLKAHNLKRIDVYGSRISPVLVSGEGADKKYHYDLSFKHKRGGTEQELNIRFASHADAFYGQTYLTGNTADLAPHSVECPQPKKFESDFAVSL